MSPVSLPSYLSMCLLSPTAFILRYYVMIYMFNICLTYFPLDSIKGILLTYSLELYVKTLDFILNDQFSSVRLLSHVRLFATPWITACHASLSITNFQSSPKLMCIELVMPSSHLILCCPLLLLPQIPPSIRVFSNESTFRMRWPKYWSFSFSISPSNEHPGLVSIRMG